MLRRLRPREVVAVGASFASALLLDVNERDLDRRTHVTFVEPRRERVEALVHADDRPHVRTLRTSARDVAPEELDVLAAGDLLLVDVPSDAERARDVSDVVLRLLPRLRPGVVVHLPHVVWPFELPAATREQHTAPVLDVVHAFLQYNSAFEILLFTSQLVAACGDVATRLVPQLALDAGGSLWLRRTTSRR